jgi:hypothetical protein
LERYGGQWPLGVITGVQLLLIKMTSSFWFGVGDMKRGMLEVLELA